MKILTAVVLICLTAMPSLPATGADSRTPAQTIRSLQEGRKIRIELKDGRKLNGRRGKLSSESFTLNSSDKRAANSQEIPFDEVEWVSVGMTGKQKALTVGGICLLALILIGLTVGSRV